MIGGGWVTPALLKILHGPRASLGFLSECLVLTTGGALTLLLPLLGLSLKRKEKPHLIRLRIGWVFFVSLYHVLDVQLSLRFGRHLTELVSYVALPEGREAGGGAALLLGALAQGVALSALPTLAFVFVRRRMLTSNLPSKLPVQAAAFSLFGALCLGSVLLPLAMSRRGPSAQTSTLLLSAPVRFVALPSGADYSPREPSLAHLQAQLRKTYRSYFSFAYAPTKQESVPSIELGARSVSLVVAESLRHTQLNPELMPRLSAWAARGARMNAHYAGSNHSESGLFALLYGRSLLRYDSTLDARVPPSACRLFQQNGGRCGYYTGHPRIWLRREDFLNPKFVDDFVQDRTGERDWNGWDSRALKRSAVALAGGAPRFNLVFLMSSHFEYRYPEKYEQYLPADPPGVLWDSAKLKRDEITDLQNRYKNVCRYLDDLVADHIESLDLTKTYFIFTGDHGESTGEDGRFGHGYSFSDPLTRVPFFILGPGVAPSQTDQLTLHADVLPTLLSLLGRTPDGSTRYGRPMLQGAPPRTHLFQAYKQPRQPVFRSLLQVGSVRVRLMIDAREPLLDVTGLENDRGDLIPGGLSNAQASAVAAAFEDELRRTGAPLF